MRGRIRARDAIGRLDLRTREFRDHVNFDARAEWNLRHTDGTARMDAPLARALSALRVKTAISGVSLKNGRTLVPYGRYSLGSAAVADSASTMAFVPARSLSAAR